MVINIFSHSIDSILLIVSLIVRKLFSLMYFHLLTFAFVPWPFGVISKKIITKTSVKVFLSYDFLQEFKVPCLMFKSLLHFKLTFVGGV